MNRFAPAALFALALAALPGAVRAQDPQSSATPRSAEPSFSDPCDRSPLLNAALVPDALLPGPDGIVPELSPISLRGLSEGDLLRALQALTTATVQRPACADDAMALAALSVALKDLPGLERARAALQSVEDAASAERPMPASVWLWQARIEAATGGARGLEFAQKAIAVEAEPSSAALAAARAAWAVGNEAAAIAAYRQGLVALADGGPMDGWLGDLGPLIRDDEAAALGGLDNLGAVRWLLGFWERRAAEAGVTVEERISEHYRRVRHVHRHLCQTCVLGPVDEAEVVVPWGRVGMGLDERGPIYLMHGEPTRSSSTDGNNLPPNVAWQYRRAAPDDDLMIHFAVVNPRSGFEIMENPLSIILPVVDPTEVDTTQAGDLPPGVRPNCIGEGCRGRYNPDFERYLFDLARLDPAYQPLAQRYRRSDGLGENSQANFVIGGVLANERSFEMQAREMLEWARARDSFVPAGAEVVEIPAALFTFKDPGGGTEVVVVAGPLPPDVDPSSVRADVTLAPLDRGDPTRGSAEVLAGGSIPVVVPVTVTRAGPYTHRVAFRSGPGPRDPVVAIGGGQLEVPDFGRPALTLSDLVLGQGGPANFRRGGAELRIAPDLTYRAGEPLAIYHEIYDLAPAERYRTTIRVERASGDGVWGRVTGLFGRGGEELPELSFEGEAPADRLVTRSYELGLTQLPAGRYRLVVEVEGQGRQNRQQLDFTLR